MFPAAFHSKLTNSSYLVTKSVKALYNGASGATLTLTGTAPTVNYRLRITLSGTDCDGTVTIDGTENVRFYAAGKKVTTTTLTANSLPTVTTANLSCTILIECLDVGGSPIYSETETAIDVSWNDTQKWIPSPEGGWTAITATTAETDNSTIDVGDVLRKTSAGSDYQVKAVHPIKNLLGLEIKRRLTF